MKKLLIFLALLSFFYEGDAQITPIGGKKSYVEVMGGIFIDSSARMPIGYTYTFTGLDSTARFWYDNPTKSIWYHNGTTRQRIANKNYVDSLVAASSGSVTLTGDVSGTGASPITTTLATVISPSNCNFCSLTYDAKGRVTAAFTGAPVISVTAGSGLSGGTITNTGTISLSPAHFDTTIIFTNVEFDGSGFVSLTIPSGYTKVLSIVAHCTSDSPNLTEQFVLNDGNIPSSTALEVYSWTTGGVAPLQRYRLTVTIRP